MKYSSLFSDDLDIYRTITVTQEDILSGRIQNIKIGDRNISIPLPSDAVSGSVYTYDDMGNWGNYGQRGKLYLTIHIETTPQAPKFPWKQITLFTGVAVVIAAVAAWFLLSSRKESPSLSVPESSAMETMITEPTQPGITTAEDLNADILYFELKGNCLAWEASKEYLLAVQYLQGYLDGHSVDPRIRELYQIYVSMHENAVLETAQEYASKFQYRMAIQYLTQAGEDFDSSRFRDAAAQYRQEFGIFNTSYIAAGKHNTIVINADKTVTAVGDNAFMELDANEWADIIAVSAGDRHLVGLRADGSVVTAGNGSLHQRDVNGWWDVIAISAGDTQTMALQADGTVLQTGEIDVDEKSCDAQTLMNAAGSNRIVSIAAGYGHILALLEDGRVVADGDNNFGECDVSHWRDIAAIYAGSEMSIGLKIDGTVVGTGRYVEDWELYSWKDVANLACGDYYLIGLRSSGKMMSVGPHHMNYSGEQNVEYWHDILCLSAGRDHTVAICSNGTVVTVGSNAKGQRDCEGMILPIFQQGAIHHDATMP